MTSKTTRFDLARYCKEFLDTCTNGGFHGHDGSQQTPCFRGLLRSASIESRLRTRRPQVRVLQGAPFLNNTSPRTLTPDSAPDAAKETSGAGASCPQWSGSHELARDGLRVAPVTIWRLLRRHVLGTRAQRLAVVECHTVATVGLVTERTARLRRRRRRHADAQRPGDLLSLDTFCVGKLKGVGKVWQITACDCATSYAWAQLVPGEVTADAVAA